MMAFWMRVSIYCRGRIDELIQVSSPFSLIGPWGDRTRAVVSISMACSNLGAESYRRGPVVELRDIYDKE